MFWPSRELYEFGKHTATGDVQRKVNAGRHDRPDPSGQAGAVGHRLRAEGSERTVCAGAAGADHVLAAFHSELDSGTPDTVARAIDQERATWGEAQLIQRSRRGLSGRGKCRRRRVVE